MDGFLDCFTFQHTFFFRFFNLKCVFSSGGLGALLGSAFQTLNFMAEEAVRVSSIDTLTPEGHGAPPGSSSGSLLASGVWRPLQRKAVRTRMSGTTAAVPQDKAAAKRQKRKARRAARAHGRGFDAAVLNQQLRDFVLSSEGLLVGSPAQ
jgi:hypothetical protein